MSDLKDSQGRMLPRSKRQLMAEYYPPNCKNYSYNMAVLRTLKPGDLIEIKRGYYSHWAVFAGGEDVIHLAGEGNDGANADLEARHVFVICGTRFKKARVTRDNFWPVAKGFKVAVNNRRDKKWTPFPPEEIVARALTKMGRVEYNLLFENCEHFVTWCRYGKSKSEQAERLMMGVGAASVGAAVSLVAGARAFTRYWKTSRPAQAEQNHRRPHLMKTASRTGRGLEEAPGEQIVEEAGEEVVKKK